MNKPTNTENWQYQVLVRMQSNWNYHAVGGNVQWLGHSTNSMAVSFEFNIHLSYDPAVPFLDIYPSEMKMCSHKHLVLPVNVYRCFISICPKLKRPKYPSPEKQINRLWFIHTMEYYSAIKREKLLIYNNMD